MVTGRNPRDDGDRAPVQFPPAPGGWQWSDKTSEEVKNIVTSAFEYYANNDEAREEAVKRFEERTKMSEEQAPASLEELAWETIKANRVEPLDIKWIPESDGRGRIKLLIVIRKGTVFLQVWEGENHVKEFKSGIGANEMAFFFEDMVIPFRDMFEELGFSVTEEISIE